jgi:hypothetical protein
MKNLSNLISDFNTKAKAIKELETRFPPAIGVICVREIKGNFVKMQGVWPKRKKMTDFLYEYNRTNDYRTPKLGKKSRHVNPYKGSVVHANRPILIQTRNLIDSITYNASGKGVLIGVFHRMSKLGHDSLSYARLLNEGGTMKVFNHQGHMPQRKFMPLPSEGPTPTMWISIDKKYKSELSKIMGSWKI